MKLKLYNLAIVAAIISFSKAVEERSEFNGCLDKYLQLKIQFKNESVVEQTTSGCIYITTLLETFLHEPVHLSETNKCVAREMNIPFMFYVVRLQVKLLQSESMESREIIIPPKFFTNLMKYAWIAASLKCVNNEEVNNIFDTAGIKIVMISTPEEKYCFAKFAKDLELFQSNNVEVNPFGFSIIDINCRAIIQEKREQFSYAFPDFVFRMGSFWKVLDYIELPKETKEAERILFKKKFAERLLQAIAGIPDE